MNAVTDSKKKMDYVNFYALNECPSRPPPGAPASEPWRTVLDSHIGTVITQEIKNNSFKVAKWTAQSILAGVDMMKIGFVSRALPRDRSNHYILNVQMQRPLTLAAQSSLSLGGMWGIIRVRLSPFSSTALGITHSLAMFLFFPFLFL